MRVGFIKTFIDNNYFISDKDGKTIFYPWGKFGKGYIIQSKQQEEQLHRFFVAFSLIQICLLFLISATVGPGFTIILLPFFILILFLWVRMSTKGLVKAPPLSDSGLLWKMYSWFLLVMLVMDSIVNGINQTFTGLKVLDIMIALWAIFGLFSYAHKKVKGNATSWKVFFFIFVIWSLAYNFIIEPLSDSTVKVFNNIVGMVLLVPLFVALYLYSFKFMSKDSQ